MKRWLLLLLVPVVAAAPQHEDAVLDARIDATYHIDLDPTDLREVFEVIPPSQESFGDGCHVAGVFRYSPGAFRFEEQREEAGCGEVRLGFDLPDGVDEIGITFLTNRELQYSSQNETLQLPPDNPQRLRVYGEQGQLIQEFTVYQDRSPHAPADIEFNAVVPTAQLGANVTFGWYFEDTGSGLAPLVGGYTGRQFIARVHDVRITLHDMPVDMTPPATTRSVVEGNVTRDTIRTVVSVPPDAAGPDAWLKIRHLDAVAASTILAPDGTPIEAVERIAVGSQHLLVVHAQTPGDYTLSFSGTTPVPVVPPVPPTQLFWLVYAAISVTAMAYVAATAHQVWFARDAAEHQRTTVVRKNIELAFLGIALVVVAIYILVRALEEMATVPPSTYALGLYGALGILTVLAVVHLGIGVLRRKHANDLRRAERIEEANRVLARSNRDLEQFAYVASHDLQEPLRKVASFTSLLEKRYGEQLDTKGQGYVHNANEAAVRARRLIQDLLAFSRIGHDAPTEPIDLNVMMAEIADDLDDELRRHDGTLTTGRLPTVPGAPPLIRQLLLNLVGNAIKYRHPDRAPEVQVVASRRGDLWRISVRDNGLGIAPEHQKQVFQIFQRLHGRGSGYEGSGIGLAICQRIVEYHGGRIGLRSRPGHGSEFYVELPMREGG